MLLNYLFNFTSVKIRDLEYRTKMEFFKILTDHLFQYRHQGNWQMHIHNNCSKLKNQLDLQLAANHKLEVETLNDL